MAPDNTALSMNGGAAPSRLDRRPQAQTAADAGKGAAESTTEAKVNEQTRHKLVEAFKYFESTETQRAFREIADDITGRITRLATSRVKQERVLEWIEAHAQRGRGSTFVRANIVGTDILEPAARVPSSVASPTRNEFLRLVTAEVEAACDSCGAKLT